MAPRSRRPTPASDPAVTATTSGSGCAQDQHSPNGKCFGCGPANKKGLRIKSRWEGDAFVCDWKAEPHHQAFDGIVNGGIVGTLLDCHSNWCAATTLMRRDGLKAPPPTVTSEFHVRLKRITPLHDRLRLVARVVETKGPVVTVEAEIRAGGETTATCRGVFVAVKEGHPAYQRWR